ncbi:MAG TPA: hemerythrin domain-containing protein [Candidatus Obscuribacterales bacterium]
MNAIDILCDDHRKVDALFKRFEAAKTSSEREDIVQEIVSLIHMHMTLEEEFFYPQLKECMRKREIDEAQARDSSIKIKIDQLQRLLSEEDGDEYNKKVQELKATIDAHTRHEEKEMMPKVERSGLDLTALGRQIEHRKSEFTKAGTVPASDQVLPRNRAQPEQVE